MNKKMKDILMGIVAVVVVVVCAVSFLSSDLEHIEDTNGPDDYALTTITDENIVNMDMGALNAVGITESGVSIAGFSMNSAVNFSSDNFTGVYEIMYNSYILPSDCVIRLLDLKVKSGNFRMAVVHDGEIVEIIEPSDEIIECRLEDVTGTVSLRIAGESAAYSFSMFQSDYDEFAHP